MNKIKHKRQHIYIIKVRIVRKYISIKSIKNYPKKYKFYTKL